jgi:hypothetical protein
LREQIQVLSIPSVIGLIASLFARTLPLFLESAGISLAWLAFIWLCYWVIVLFRFPID